MSDHMSRPTDAENLAHVIAEALKLGGHAASTKTGLIELLEELADDLDPTVDATEPLPPNKKMWRGRGTRFLRDLASFLS